MLGLLRAAASGALDRGASAANIDALPTRIYRAPAAVAGAEEKTADEREKERVTCMVCLMEYGQTMQRMHPLRRIPTVVQQRRSARQ